LSASPATSNTFFETFDQLNVGPTSLSTYNVVTILASNSANTRLIISDPLPANQLANNFTVIKKPNVNTTLANSLVTFAYSNTGPASMITVTSAGSGYISVPTLGIIANTRIQELGILGKLDINSGGTGYIVGDVIGFDNIVGGYGTGAIAQVSSINVSNSNTITAVQFTEMTGHLIGGSGYNANFLPTANIISANATASGADITVNCLLGSGATLVSANSTLGAIREITLSSGGSGYTEAPTIDMTGSGDGTANLTASFITGVKTYAGRYLNDDGFISSFNFLEDRDYYQNYSYVIRINEPLDKYRKAIKDLIHPAGMKLFGEYTYTTEFDSYASPTSSNVSHASEDSMIWLPKTYVKTGNTINVSYASHGLSISTNVFLEFTSGGANVNVGNGIFTVSSNARANSFDVIQYGPIASITTDTSNSGVGYTGIGYPANSHLVFTNEDTGSGANGTFAIISSNVVSTIAIISGGTGYNVSTGFIEFTGGGGTGANASFRVNNVIAAANTVNLVTLLASGSGYTSEPTATINLSNITVASFTTNVANGVITSINIASYGINYSSTPTVTANGTNSSAALFNVAIAYANSTSGSVNVGIYII